MPLLGGGVGGGERSFPLSTFKKADDFLRALLSGQLATFFFGSFNFFFQRRNMLNPLVLWRPFLPFPPTNIGVSCPGQKVFFLFFPIFTMGGFQVSLAGNLQNSFSLPPKVWGLHLNFGGRGGAFLSFSQ